MKIVTTILLAAVSIAAYAQNYTSTANGAWTSSSNWSNTSGWGTATPPLDGSQGSGTITMNNNMTISSPYNTGSATLNINASKTLTVNAAMTVGGGSTVNVSGNLVIYGDLTLNGYLKIAPGGVVTVYGNVIVNSSPYLVVGTNASGPPYADLVVKNDIKQKGSGDVVLNKNARVAVFGSVTSDNSGGSSLTLNQGAEMYVNGNVGYTGGGDQIANNNAINPYGLYVNGTTTNTGGGSSTTSNEGNKATMSTTNIPFTNWVNSQQSLMPVTLTSFEAGVNENRVELKWSVSSEENLDYYLLESSTDGREFSELAHVSGGKHDYTYMIEQPVVGKSYYRLTSVDLNGYTETFKIVTANYATTKRVSIFPNPVVDSKLNVNFNFLPTDDVTVSITSLTGIEVSHLVINGMENLLLLQLEPGTYIVRVQSTEVSAVSRILTK